MEIINTTPLLTGYTMGVEPSAREWLVLVIKGTYRIPEQDAAPELAETQWPLVMADTFTGEPGRSAPIEEVDFALRKPRCDILLTGSAWTPGGRPAERIPVGLRVGNWSKSFAVCGERQWSSGLTGSRATRPLPFVRQPISYDGAFGGLDDFHADPDRHGAFVRNPVGRGWHCQLAAKYVDGTPLPCTEELARPVDRPDGDFAPMAFGPVGRSWASRLELAGTYDQSWLADTFPFLPADFQDAYYQAAPADQQIAHLRGGEEVTLVNLDRSGRRSFRLPTVDLPVVFFRSLSDKLETRAVLDTLVLKPDEGCFSLVWRASVPLRRNMLEITEALVGSRPASWWRARKLGKTWHASLAEAVAVRRAEETAAQ